MKNLWDEERSTKNGESGQADWNASFLVLHSSFTLSSSITRLSMMKLCRSMVFLPI